YKLYAIIYQPMLLFRQVRGVPDMDIQSQFGFIAYGTVYGPYDSEEAAQKDKEALGAADSDIIPMLPSIPATARGLLGTGTYPLGGRDKVNAIISLREVYNLGLADAKAYIEAAQAAKESEAAAADALARAADN